MSDQVLLDTREVVVFWSQELGLAVGEDTEISPRIWATLTAGLARRWRAFAAVPDVLNTQRACRK